MPCFLRKQLREKDFEENFNNTVLVRKTLILFSFKKRSSILWKTWGYAYNDPGNQHAECLVLSNIEQFIAENQIKGKYKMTFFMSHTPCHKCSDKIVSFLASRKGLSMKIKASRPYFLNEGRKGLYLLKRIGVLLKMMDRTDFEECFYLFVHPLKTFTPWSDLDEQSKKNMDDLAALWKQAMDDNFIENEKKTEEKTTKELKICIHDSTIESLIISDFAASQLDVDEVLESPCEIPEVERFQLGPETPQKMTCSDKATEAVQSVKRKLEF
uniref:CMP/dCMP-type deaminase domain-containing protein n=1 Tax=Anolis carolinensis TaxID=28377 RepID=G1KV46_ANOCA|nr:PREDICTED: single-stranded DNA cytosine deaminase [Anolis carolinensis]|eukprot:XP_008105138.1 PREDICTED: single-stranded DNA cytosine deaminase [Anolis carolinensis]